MRQLRTLVAIEQAQPALRPKMRMRVQPSRFAYASISPSSGSQYTLRLVLAMALAAFLAPHVPRGSFNSHRLETHTRAAHPLSCRLTVSDEIDCSGQERGGGGDTYDRCIRAVDGSAEQWEEFFKRLVFGKNKTVGGESQNRACWSKTYESPNNKKQWCENQFGGH